MLSEKIVHFHLSVHCRIPASCCQVLIDFGPDFGHEKLLAVVDYLFADCDDG